MIKHTYDRESGSGLVHKKCEPVCGQDFCDDCGDCLCCYGDDPCYGSKSGFHWWAVYIDEPKEALDNPKPVV